MLKHPLQNTWTLWYLENDRSKSWQDMQNEIMSFDTAEDFWSLYNHIKPPSDIKIGSDYSLFKKGIRPMWEDAANKKGGRWVITLNCTPKTEVDNLWLDVLLCLIGEAFDHSDQICGAVVNIRNKHNKISIWTANGYNREAALEIGHKLRDALHLGRQSLQYQLHQDTMDFPDQLFRFTITVRTAPEREFKKWISKGTDRVPGNEAHAYNYIYHLPDLNRRGGPPAESGPLGPKTPSPREEPRKCGGSSSSSSSLADPIKESIRKEI
uniref:eIF-4F 25 kDa subunit n=1 Tax=Glossina brevipalpis TaxID=37001 RepID=A0A1A9WX13_9MUSC